MGSIFLEKVKEKYPDIDVIIITGYATIDNAILAIKKGAFDFISKPLNYDYIIGTINKVFNFKKF